MTCDDVLSRPLAGPPRSARRGGWAAGLAAALLSLLTLQPAAAQHEHAAAGRKRPPPLAMGAAFSPSGELWIVALDAEHKLFVQSSADDGRSWSAARSIDTGSDKVVADGENRPKLAFGPKGWAVISYTEPLAKPYTGQIRMLRSEDGGRSFSPPFTVHQDRQVITHRFESVAFDAQGALHTLWIDKRDLEAAGRVARKPKNEADYRGAAIYRNVSTDGGRSFGPDLKLADHSCECCRIALAPAPDGSLVALWRHVFAPNQRDHAFAPLSALPGSETVRATFDRWAIDACPHHGPGLAPAAAGGYHAVWFGERAGAAGVRYGRLHADGSPLGEARPLPDERAEHAAVQSAGARVAIVWRSFDGQVMRWRAWLSADGGGSFALKELGSSSADSDHPLLLKRADQIFALWRTTQGVRVERLFP